jgi:hypothetical protein
MATRRTSNCLLLIAAIVTVTIGSISLTAQNPAGLWKLNEGSGDQAFDSSGGNRTASLSDGIRWTNVAGTWAISGSAARKGYVTIPATDLSATNAVSVAFWVKRTYTTSGDSVLFEASKSYLGSETGFALLPDDEACHGIQAALRGNEGITANCYAQPSSGVWHHFAIVYDKSQTGGNAVAFYVDGALQNPSWNLSSATNTNNFGNDPIYLLSRAGSSKFSSGTISDLRIYDSPLTAEQVQQISKDTTLASPSPISYMQGNYADPQASQPTVTVPFNLAQTAGDLNVVVVGWKDSRATVSQVTDSKGNVYTRAVGPTIINNTATQSIYYAKNIASAGAGTNSVTITFSTSARSPNVSILEYSGADTNNPVDVTAAHTGVSRTSSSGSASTTNATDLILGANLVLPVTTGPGSGFTTRLLTVPQGNIVEDQTVSTTGSYSASAPLIPMGNWIMQMVAFRTPGSPTLVSISVTPTNPSISVGAHQQFTATGNYSNGSHQDLTNSATWTSSSLSVATISSAGLATGVASGSTTIKAASGSIYGTTTLTVTGAPPTFTISASPASLSVAQGNQGTSTITTAVSSGFNSPITLSASGVPTGTTVSFNPATIPAPGSGSSTMTITVGSSTPTGTYPIVVTGNGGGAQQSVTVTLTVTGPTGVISLDGNVHGVHDNYTTYSNTASLSIGTPTAGDLIACEVTFDSGSGNTLVSVSDNHNGTYGAAIPMHLNSSLVQWYGLYYAQNVSASPTTITVTTTQARPYLAIACQAWKGVATSGALDTGFSQFQDAVNVPNPTTGTGRTPSGNGELIVTALGPATAGTPTPGSHFALVDGAPSTQYWPEYWVQGTATSTNGNYTWPSDTWTDLMAAFRPAAVTGNFTLSASPSSLTVAQGNQGTSTLTTTVSGGFNNSIGLSASGVPSGTTVSFSPTTIPAPGSGTSNMTITVGTSTPAGTYPITVTGSGGGIQQTAIVTLTVTAGTGFTVSASPASLSVLQGTQATSTITTAVSGGFNSSISLSASGTPTGTTVTFNPTTIPAPGSGNSVMSISVGATTPMGTYPITVTATGGGTHQTVTVTLTVTAQIALSWTASPGTAGYNVYRSTTNGGQYSRINSSLVTTTNYNDQAVQDGQTYYYVTTAVSSQGMESGYSNQASATMP